MDLELNDRVVIVTGAAAGIGQSTAGLLTAEGAVVVGVDRDDVEAGLGEEGSDNPCRSDRSRQPIGHRRDGLDALRQDRWAGE